ncbi:hypothetical protein K7432_005649 [Basidiobolus ranarum]|uniref:RING-type domain-containing protein n=1 Tax=Basidiobolus ranarum TaxID=34480 RepID=A0ABR2WW93_9FUNG
MATPKTQPSINNSREVIDLTELPDTSHHQPINNPNQVICVEEGATLSSRHSSNQALIILSDEEPELLNVSDSTSSNQVDTNRSLAQNNLTSFRNYGNYPIFDYNYIREPYIEGREVEEPRLLDNEEAGLDSSTDRLHGIDSNSTQGANVSQTREAAIIAEPLEEFRSLESGENNMGIKCSICLDNPQKLTTTFCGHLFCDECIHRSIKTPSKACPVCRKPLTLKKMRVLQLRVVPNHPDSSSEELTKKKKVKLSN